MASLAELIWDFPHRFSSTTHRIGRTLRRDVIGLTPAQIRVSLDRLAALYPGHYSVGFEMLSLGDVPAARLYPRHQHKFNFNEATNQAVLLVHGGGFAFGSPRTHRALASALVRQTGVEVWVPDYRLAPEHPFPTPLDDVANALRELSQRKRGGIWVVGDSAGGNLAISAVLDEIGSLDGKILGLMLLSPWLDLRPQSVSNQSRIVDTSPFDRLDMLEYAIHYLGRTPPNEARVCPLIRNLSKLPAVYAEASHAEYLWPDFAEFRKAFAKSSQILTFREEPNALHGWQLFPDVLPEAKRSILAMAEFMKATQHV